VARNGGGFVLDEKALGRAIRTDLYLDLAELFSGLLLVGFLWTHMLFEGAILFGEMSYNTLAAFLDRYYLPYAGIPLLGLIAAIHVFAVTRRFPHQYRIFWRHLRTVNHLDTWTWFFQLLTAFVVTVLVLIHVWLVLSDWPISAAKSAERIASYRWLYVALLCFTGYHAAFGLYRQFVKWGWINRHRIGPVLKFMHLVIVGLGLVTIWVFAGIGGVR